MSKTDDSVQSFTSQLLKQDVKSNLGKEGNPKSVNEQSYKQLQQPNRSWAAFKRPLSINSDIKRQALCCATQVEQCETAPEMTARYLKAEFLSDRMVTT